MASASSPGSSRRRRLRGRRPGRSPAPSRSGCRSPAGPSARRSSGPRAPARWRGPGSAARPSLRTRSSTVTRSIGRSQWLLPSILNTAGRPKSSNATMELHRVARQAQVRHATAVRRGEGAERQRLAGLHAHGPEVDFAFLEQHVLDHVVVAAGDAGRRDEHVGVERLVHLRRQVFDRVAGDAEASRARRRPP